MWWRKMNIVDYSPVYTFRFSPRVIARCEAISKLYRVALQIGDCFVPRNDAWREECFSILLFSSVSRIASGESGQNNGGPVRLQGHSKFLL